MSLRTGTKRVRTHKDRVLKAIEDFGAPGVLTVDVGFGWPDDMSFEEARPVPAAPKSPTTERLCEELRGILARRDALLRRVQDDEDEHAAAGLLP